MNKGERAECGGEFVDVDRRGVGALVESSSIFSNSQKGRERTTRKEIRISQCREACDPARFSHLAFIHIVDGLDALCLISMRERVGEYGLFLGCVPK